MSETTGVTMRILALDELMKVLTEVGRSAPDPQQREMLKSLFTAAKERHDFLKLNQRDEDQG